MLASRLRLWVAFPAVLVLTACSDSGGAPSGVPQHVYDGCVRYTTVACEKVFDCAPNMAKVLFQANSKADCSARATTECSNPAQDESGQECNPVWPSQAQIDACVADTKKWTCNDFMQSSDGPPSCQAISDPCPDGIADGSVAKHDGAVAPLDGPMTKQDQGSTSKCPYTTSSFSCDAACQSLWTIMQKCSSDPGLPPNVKAAFQVMASLPQAKAVLACKATCVSGSASYPAQWKCFQAAPADSCQKIASCTAASCP